MSFAIVLILYMELIYQNHFINQQNTFMEMNKNIKNVTDPPPDTTKTTNR